MEVIVLIYISPLLFFLLRLTKFKAEQSQKIVEFQGKENNKEERHLEKLIKGTF